MRRKKFIVGFLSLTLVLLLGSCAKVTGPEKEVIIKITARRIAQHGLKAQPDVFRSLAIVARESCQHLTERSQPSDVAFQIILETIATKTSDPLLAQDIQDIVALIGIKFDPDFTLVNLGSGHLKLITLFVCSFAQGVDTAKEVYK